MPELSEAQPDSLPVSVNEQMLLITPASSRDVWPGTTKVLSAEVRVALRGPPDGQSGSGPVVRVSGPTPV